MYSNKSHRTFMPQQNNPSTLQAPVPERIRPPAHTAIYSTTARRTHIACSFTDATQRHLFDPENFKTLNDKLLLITTYPMVAGDTNVVYPNICRFTPQLT